MYVTRRLSQYYDNPEAASEPPPEGPASGILVVEDEEAIARARHLWGLWKDSRMYGLPFPQNKMLKVRYTTTSTSGTGPNGAAQTHTHTHRDDVIFIPVVDQPLSSNRYYVVRAAGRNMGKISRCSREEDMTTCCFCTFVNDVAPAPFDHRDMYQQVEVIPRSHKFRAKAVAPDGIPPDYLRRKGWRVYTSSSTGYNLTEAPGMNSPLRDRMPDLNFSVSTKHSPLVLVGKWYCPFIFIKEGERPKDQMKRCAFYEMSLEQKWEQIYSCENVHHRGNQVQVGVTVRRTMALLNGNEAVRDGMENVDGVMWFKPVNSAGRGLGLSMAMWERIRWELERGGWEDGDGNVERVERVERCEMENGWERFGCYVLVERFALRRMDGTGSLALTYEFKHTNKIRTKWE